MCLCRSELGADSIVSTAAAADSTGVRHYVALHGTFHDVIRARQVIITITIITNDLCLSAEKPSAVHGPFIREKKVNKNITSAINLSDRARIYLPLPTSPSQTMNGPRTCDHRSDNFGFRIVVRRFHCRLVCVRKNGRSHPLVITRIYYYLLCLLFSERFHSSPLFYFAFFDDSNVCETRAVASPPPPNPTRHVRPTLNAHTIHRSSRRWYLCTRHTR